MRMKHLLMIDLIYIKFNYNEMVIIKQQYRLIKSFMTTSEGV